MPSLSASTHHRCHRKLCRRRVPKSEMRRFGCSRSCSTSTTSWPWRGIEDVQRERAEPFHRRARAQLVDDRERGDFPHSSSRPSGHGTSVRTGRHDATTRIPEGGILRARPEIPARRSACGHRSCYPRAISFLLVKRRPRAWSSWSRSSCSSISSARRTVFVRLISERSRPRPDRAARSSAASKACRNPIQQAADDRIELPGMVIDPSRDIGLWHLQYAPLDRHDPLCGEAIVVDILSPGGDAADAALSRPGATRSAGRRHRACAGSWPRESRSDRCRGSTEHHRRRKALSDRIECEKPTQKSVARRQSVTLLYAALAQVTGSPVGVRWSFSKKAE